ncbi:Phytochrome A-associated F-box protein [Sarracenia purpurea var. burkii]
MAMVDPMFSNLSDDVVLNIFFKLEDDPRNWARLACVCTKFSSLIRNICWKIKCSQTIPSVVSDLFSTSSAGDAPPGGWAALHKLAVCCPGLLHAGVLLENSDFGLEREIGPDENYQENRLFQLDQGQTMPPSSSGFGGNSEAVVSGSECSWSLFDDLYFDTVYNASESQDRDEMDEDPKMGVIKTASEFSVCNKRKICRSFRSHLASGVWNLSREQGNKLLASRFRGDCLYVCDWPGCVHIEEKRNYMLFRGIFKNFKRSRVWRTINDGNRSKVDLNCAFCSCKQTWDLHSAFCLRRVFGYHDDGEPVVRAYVCENGHVSGAWTDWPLYT